MKRLNRCFNFKFPKLQNLNLSCNCISRDVIKVKLNLHECIETRCVHWFDDLTSLWFLKGHVFFFNDLPRGTKLENFSSGR